MLLALETPDLIPQLKKIALELGYRLLHCQENGTTNSQRDMKQRAIESSKSILQSRTKMRQLLGRGDARNWKKCEHRAWAAFHVIHKSCLPMFQRRQVDEETIDAAAQYVSELEDRADQTRKRRRIDVSTRLDELDREFPHLAKYEHSQMGRGGKTGPYKLNESQIVTLKISSALLQRSQTIAPGKGCSSKLANQKPVVQNPASEKTFAQNSISNKPTTTNCSTGRLSDEKIYALWAPVQDGSAQKPTAQKSTCQEPAIVAHQTEEPTLQKHPGQQQPSAEVSANARIVPESGIVQNLSTTEPGILKLPLRATTPVSPDASTSTNSYSDTDDMLITVLRQNLVSVRASIRPLEVQELAAKQSLNQEATVYHEKGSKLTNAKLAHKEKMDNVGKRRTELNRAKDEEKEFKNIMMEAEMDFNASKKRKRDSEVALDRSKEELKIKRIDEIKALKLLDKYSKRGEGGPGV